jgi:hypothetical protein
VSFIASSPKVEPARAGLSKQRSVSSSVTDRHGTSTDDEPHRRIDGMPCVKTRDTVHRGASSRVVQTSTVIAASS